MVQTLYLMMGLPGAGKTTAAQIIEELTGAVRLSSDEARLMIWPEPTFSQQEHQELYEYLDEQTERLLRAGKSIVYDANLNRLMHRQEKYVLAQKVGVKTVLCWVQTPREVAKARRLGAAEHHGLVPHNEDPAKMFERIADVIEPPNEHEQPALLDGTKITAAYIKQQLGI